MTAKRSAQTEYMPYAVQLQVTFPQCNCLHICPRTARLCVSVLRKTFEDASLGTDWFQIIHYYFSESWSHAAIYKLCFCIFIYP